MQAAKHEQGGVWASRRIAKKQSSRLRCKTGWREIGEELPPFRLHRA
jgi:hypothetical protein